MISSRPRTEGARQRTRAPTRLLPCRPRPRRRPRAPTTRRHPAKREPFRQSETTPGSRRARGRVVRPVRGAATRSARASPVRRTTRAAPAGCSVPIAPPRGERVARAASAPSSPARRPTLPRRATAARRAASRLEVLARPGAARVQRGLARDAAIRPATAIPGRPTRTAGRRANAASIARRRAKRAAEERALNPRDRLSGPRVRPALTGEAGQTLGPLAGI